MIYLIDTYNDNILVIKRIDIERGIVLNGRIFVESTTNQIKHLIWSIEKDSCTKVIFDVNKRENANKEAYLRRLSTEMRKHERPMFLDANGNVSYLAKHNIHNEIL